MLPTVLPDAWTDRQSKVIGLPIGTRALVIAAAGTGKTAVTIERLARLIDDEGLAPGSEVLLLSFTRSAVGEIKRRLRATGGRAGYARVSTLDSLATALLYHHSTEEKWTDSGYDGRIEACIELLETNTEASNEVAGYRHVFVDEIQDLVGIRAQFVITLLAHSDGGFTALGDPAQAIYDWQETGGPIDNRIFDELRHHFGEQLKEYSLDGNHRAITDSARIALPMGQALRQPDPDYRSIGSELHRLVATLPQIGSIQAAAHSLRNPTGPTAILTRSNGQALIISGNLRDNNINHQLQRPATERAIQPWVARAFLDINVNQLGRSIIQERIAASTEDEDPETTWRLLKRLDPTPGNGLSIDKVRDRIRLHHVPDELTKSEPANLIVSTIHRAKGLEFDSVILTEPKALGDVSDEDLPGEIRALYVAMTRPRKKILRIAASPERLFPDPRTRRWVKCGRRGSWQTIGFEVQGDDLDRVHPAGEYLLQDTNPRELQDYLWEMVHPGDSVEFKFLKSTIAGRIIGYFVAVHDGRMIGVTSEGFGSLLNLRLHGHPNHNGRWPTAITGLYVESIDTVAGTSAASTNAGLGTAGIWLRPRVIGLGELKW